MTLKPQYNEPESESPLRIRELVSQLDWVGPREIEESRSWPMLAIGGTHSAVTPTHIIDAVRDAAMSPTYPPTMGNLALRQAIADRLESEFGRPVNPHSEILITNGSMQALHLAVEACNTNGNAVSHAPSFFYADIAAAVAVQLT